MIFWPKPWRDGLAMYYDEKIGGGAGLEWKMQN